MSVKSATQKILEGVDIRETIATESKEDSDFAENFRKTLNGAFKVYSLPDPYNDGVSEEDFEDFMDSYKAYEFINKIAEYLESKFRTAEEINIPMIGFFKDKIRVLGCVAYSKGGEMWSAFVSGEIKMPVPEDLSQLDIDELEKACKRSKSTREVHYNEF